MPTSQQCPHQITALDGQTARCRLAEFSLYALTEENARLRRGLAELRTVLGQPPQRGRGEVLSLEGTRLVEACAFLEALLSHAVTPLQ